MNLRLLWLLIPLLLCGCQIQIAFQPFKSTPPTVTVAKRITQPSNHAVAFTRHQTPYINEDGNVVISSVEYEGLKSAADSTTTLPPIPK